VKRGHDLNYVVTGLIRAATPHVYLSTVMPTRPQCDIAAAAPVATGYGQDWVIVVEPFRIHVADEVLNDCGHGCAIPRWPDQHTRYRLGNRAPSWTGYDASCPTGPRVHWRGWERRLNAFNHFTWEGIHFVYQRAASGRVCRSFSRTAAQQFLDSWTCCRCSSTSTWSYPPCPVWFLAASTQGRHQLPVRLGALAPAHV